MSTNTPTQANLDRLVAESDIHRLLATYVHNLDNGKVAENAELLAHARFQVIDTVVNGRDEITQFFKNNVRHHEDGTPRTWHTLSNIIIDIESSTTASSVSYFSVFQELPGLPLQPIVTGLYVDTFMFRDEKWCYASRQIQPRLFGNISFHVITPTDNTAD